LMEDYNQMRCMEEEEGCSHQQVHIEVQEARKQRKVEAVDISAGMDLDNHTVVEVHNLLEVYNQNRKVEVDRVLEDRNRAVEEEVDNKVSEVRRDHNLDHLQDLLKILVTHHCPFYICKDHDSDFPKKIEPTRLRRPPAQNPTHLLQGHWPLRCHQI